MGGHTVISVWLENQSRDGERGAWRSMQEPPGGGASSVSEEWVTASQTRTPPTARALVDLHWGHSGRFLKVELPKECANQLSSSTLLRGFKVKACSPSVQTDIEHSPSVQTVLECSAPIRTLLVFYAFRECSHWCSRMLCGVWDVFGSIWWCLWCVFGALYNVCV